MLSQKRFFRPNLFRLILTVALASLMLSVVLPAQAYPKTVTIGNTPEQSDTNSSLVSSLPIDASTLTSEEIGLVNKVQITGTVDVIVGLNGNYYMPSTLSAMDAEAQQQSLNAIRHDILGTLGTANVQVLSDSTTWMIPYMALSVDQAGLVALLNSPYISSVQENLRGETMMASSLNVIGASTAWARGFTGTGQTIAIIDSGVERTHPFLAGRVVNEACFSGGGGGVSSLCPNNATSQFGTGAASPAKCESMNRFSDCFHGTHVAGTAAGSNGPTYAPSGVAPGASILGVQVFSAPTNTSFTRVVFLFSDFLSGLQYVYNNRNTYNIAAVNMSLGVGNTPFNDQTTCNNYYTAFTTMFNNLRAVGIAPVVASGNDGFGTSQSWPACIGSAVSVGASTDTDSSASFSNDSFTLQELFAPGVSIYSAAPVNGACDKSDGFVDGYCISNGTSMAAPHVAGAFAVLRQALPGSSVDSLVTLMRNTGTPVTVIGGTIPRLNLAAAVNSLVPPVAPANTNLVSNSTFNSSLSGWTHWNLTADNAAGYFRMARNVGTPDGGFYTTLPYSFNAGFPVELKLNLGNNSGNGKAIQFFIRNANESDYSLTCQWSIPPGQFPDSVYTMRAIVPRNWSSLNIQAFIVPADGQMALLVDNLTLQYRPGLSVPGGLQCLYDAPANRDLIYNGNFSLGSSGWGVFNAVGTTFTNNQMNIYRQVNEGVAGGSGGGFWQQIASPLRQGAQVEWFFQIRNASSSPKNFKIYMHAVGAPGANYRGCIINNIPANSVSATYRVRTLSPSNMETIVFQGFVEPDDSAPSLVVDNLSFQYRPDLAGVIVGTTCTYMGGAEVEGLLAQGMEIRPYEDGVIGAPSAPEISVQTPELPEGFEGEPAPDAPAAELPPGMTIEPIVPDAPAAELPPGMNIVPDAPEGGS